MIGLSQMPFWAFMFGFPVLRADQPWLGWLADGSSLPQHNKTRRPTSSEMSRRNFVALIRG